jgi:hypothetical protein
MLKLKRVWHFPAQRYTPDYVSAPARSNLDYEQIFSNPKSDYLNLAVESE